MARVDHLAGGIYRISTYVPAKRISFNQFLIQDEKPALIHTGTFPMYDDVRAAVAQVLDPSRLRYIIVPHFEADECGGLSPRPHKRCLPAVQSAGGSTSNNGTTPELFRACRTAMCLISANIGCASGRLLTSTIGTR